MAAFKGKDTPSFSKVTPTHSNSVDSTMQSDAGPSRSNGSPSDDEEEAEAKRRRVQRACDLCRRKKIRCDGAQTKRNAKCSNCAEAKADCTYVEAAKRRGPPQGYIEALEFQVQRMENLIQKLDPDIDIVNELGPRICRDTFELPVYKAEMAARGISYNPTHGRRGKAAAATSVKPLRLGTDTPTRSSDASNGLYDLGTPFKDADAMLQLTRPTDKLPPQAVGKEEARRTQALKEDEEEEKHMEYKNMKMIEKLHDMRIADGYRFHGKSSGVQLLHTIMDLKYQTQEQGESKLPVGLGATHRPEFWTVPFWEASINFGRTAPLDMREWPPADLSQILIDAYFEQENTILPLFNRKIFQRDYDSGRYQHDVLFAKVCLMLFANASRLVNDPRVLWWADDEAKRAESAADDPAYKHSAGWRWLAMTLGMGKSFLAVPVLEDLQAYALLALFLLGSSSTSTAWAIAGLGLRSCQDIGVHTKLGVSRYTNQSERELHKRVFWCLVYIDRITCAGMGRTLSMQDVDFDVDYPIDVDDEYWETGDPETDFKQPEGIPSKVSYFVSVLKLSRIMGEVLKTVYAVNRETLGFDWSDPTIQKDVVAEFDSAVNSWVDAVPEHLRWDPNQSDLIFFEQSCILYALVYTLQILIHRPFLPKPGRPVSQLGVASLAICTNAARSASHVADAHLSRGLIASQHMQLATFTAAIVLLIGVWGQKKTGGIGNPTVALADVQKCLKSLKVSEGRWRQAGKLRDVLTELATMSEVPIATPSPLCPVDPQSLKRQREDVQALDYNVGGSSSEDVSSRRMRGAPVRDRTGGQSSAPGSLWMENGNSSIDVGGKTWRQSGKGQSQKPEGGQVVPGYGQNMSSLAPFPAGPWNMDPFDFATAKGPFGGNVFPSSSTRSTDQSASNTPGGIMSPTSIQHLLNGMDGTGGVPLSHGQGDAPLFDAMGGLGMLPSKEVPFGTVAHSGDINMATWPYDNTADDGLGSGPSGAVADIWSMAPWTFEMDDWTAYLRQAQPQPQLQTQAQIQTQIQGYGA